MSWKHYDRANLIRFTGVTRGRFTVLLKNGSFVSEFPVGSGGAPHRTGYTAIDIVRLKIASLLTDLGLSVKLIREVVAKGGIIDRAFSRWVDGTAFDSEGKAHSVRLYIAKGKVLAGWNPAECSAIEQKLNGQPFYSRLDPDALITRASADIHTDLKRLSEIQKHEGSVVANDPRIYLRDKLRFPPVHVEMVTAVQERVEVAR